MGTAYPSAIFAAPDGSGYTYSITAKITWDSSYYVTVESVWSDELSSDQFSWRIKGRASQGDTNTYAEKYSKNGFQGTANKEYVLQGCCVPGGVYDNSGNNYLFKLTSDSSSGGSSGSGGNTGGGSLTSCGHIHISKGEGVKTLEVTMTPWTSPSSKVYDGDQILVEDNEPYATTFNVVVEAEPGYELDHYSIPSGIIEDGVPSSSEDVLFYSTNLFLFFRITNENGRYSFPTHLLSATDVTIRATASLKEEEYTLSFNNNDNSYATVRRISSKNEDAYLGILDNGATIYSADVLDIIVGTSTGYIVENVNVSGCVANDNGTYTVIGDTNISISTSRQQGIYIDNETSWILCAPYLV